MGRPKKLIRRDRQLNVSLTLTELNTVKSRAFSAGMRLADFARSRLLSGAQAPVVAAAAVSRIERLVYLQLKRLGNNLNQLVRRLHATGEPAPPHLDPLLKDIREILNRGQGNDY
jgi:Bacterial mobilisation protein (MobC)